MSRWSWLMMLVLAACGVQDAEVVDVDEGAALDVVDAPLLGADGQDAADRECHVVLRSLERGPTTCTSGLCWWTWTGLVDISAAAGAEGARPRVLFKGIDAARWSSVSATKVAGAPQGFTRYRFQLTRDTVRDGMSATAYSRATVAVAPYLLTTSGARLFDHNRLPGDLDSYVLSQGGGWRVGEDPAVCAGVAALPRAIDFDASFRTTQRGLPVAGAPLTLTYAIERLPTCRGTHNGYPAWDVRASVRFVPSGEVVEGTVRGFDAPTGTPTNAGARGVPLVVQVPPGTTGLEVWFRNFSGAGSTCEAWDSNWGANYRFAVAPEAPPRPVWAGNPGSSFSRACGRQPGAPEVAVLDSYVWTRACAFVEVDVYVPGVTDGAELRPHALFAQAEQALDGAPLPAVDLAFVGRFGNDYRYRYEVPKSSLYYGPRWQRLEYTPRFSTDGATWLREATRAVVRDASFCNPAWPGGC